MDYFKEVIDCVVNFMKIEFSLWGYTFSLWSVFVWGILASLTLWIVKVFFLGDD